MKALYISLIILVLFNKLASAQSYSANTFQGVGWNYLYTREENYLTIQPVAGIEDTNDSYENSPRVVSRKEVEWWFSETICGKPPLLAYFYRPFYQSFEQCIIDCSQISHLVNG